METKIQLTFAEKSGTKIQLLVPEILSISPVRQKLNDDIEPAISASKEIQNIASQIDWKTSLTNEKFSKGDQVFVVKMKNGDWYQFEATNQNLKSAGEFEIFKD